MFRLFAVALAFCALALPAQARWLRAETARFVVYGDGSEADLRAYATRLEGFDALLRFYHGLDLAEVPPRKLELYLLEDRSDLGRLSPSVSEGTAGFYSSGPGDIYGAAIRSMDRGQENDDTLFHEYVHHFMQYYFPSTYPGWLLEGYAEYFMTAEVTATRFEVGRFNSGRAETLQAGEKITAREVLTLSPDAIPSGRARQAYYARAWLLTHYMLTDPARKAQLMAYVRAVHAGTESASAWTEATGEDLAMLDRRLDTYQAGSIRSAIYARPAGAPVEVTVTAMPPSADDLLLVGQYLKAGVREPYRAAVLAEVRKAAAKYPGDRLAELTLARAETLYGDRAAGEAILDQLLAANDNDLDALRIMAQGKLAAGQDAEAGRFFARAYRIEPNHYQTLYGYARSRGSDPDYPTENTLNVLRLAVQLAPQVDAIKLATARALIARDRDDEALILLRPVANDPHGGSSAAQARKLIDKAGKGG